MKSYWTVVLTVWVTGWVTHAATKVGEISHESVYPTGLPFIVFIVIAFPALLGYLIGKEST